jgi:5-formyltetrahydrofolate cyclo-ligase
MVNTFDKTQLRQEILAARIAMPIDEKEAKDKAIIDKILSLDVIASADGVLLYYPTRGEINMLRLFTRLLAQNIRTAFPRINKETDEMTFHPAESLNDFRIGAFAIKEPLSNELFEITKNTVAITPALAADKRGYRLGYGRGYYDRFLKTFPGTSICAVYGEFLFDEIPTNDGDVAVDRVVTEKIVQSTKCKVQS